MSNNQEILEKAIQKAIDGGWDKSVALNWKLLFSEAEQQTDFKSHVYGGLIFNHDFAKALWGLEPMHERPHFSGGTTADFNWRYHLQQMVIDPNPIEYLGRHLDV